MVARTLGSDGYVYIREEGNGGFVRLVGDRVRRATVVKCAEFVRGASAQIDKRTRKLKKKRRRLYEQRSDKMSTYQYLS